MRTALLTVTLLVGFATPTLAQNQTPTAQTDQSGGAEPQSGMNMRGGGRGEGGFGPMNFMGGERMGVMMRAARELAAGAFFRFKRGDDEVDIHCPPTVALQSCVGAAADLMSALRRTGSGGGGQGGGESDGGSQQR
jgi:hypothetical protein